MKVQIYGFDWETYTNLVMPVFTRWLVEREESGVYECYQRTRCAREEQGIPSFMRSMCTWPRAQGFVWQLPRDIQVCDEYRILCCPGEFTQISDRYVHRHFPQLYPASDSLRAVWGAIVEFYCQTCFSIPGYEEEESDEEGEEMGDEAPLHGILLGRHPATLHVRGWLAARSVRAMALFELLACGRRSLPFGSRAGEPYEDYCGYLTPDEVVQMASCIRCEHPPVRAEAEADYARYRVQKPEFRMIDEVLPVYADALLQVVAIAAQRGSGLLCRMG